MEERVKDKQMELPKQGVTERHKMVFGKKCLQMKFILVECSFLCQ